MPAASHSTSESPCAELDLALVAWRAQLVDLVMKVGLIVGAGLAATTTLSAYQQQDWGHLFVAWGALATSVVLARRSRLPTALKAGVAVAVLWAIGVWLLSRAAAACMAYFLSAAVMAALLIGTAPAVGVMLLCCASLVGLGHLGNIPLNVVGGTPNGSLLRWFNLSANVLLLGLLMILSVRFLLRRLETALRARQRAARSLGESEELLRQIAAQVPGMVYRLRLDAQGHPTFLYASPGSIGLFGMDPLALQSDARQLARRILPEDRQQILAL
nr:hypothetical protein [Leptothrix sp. (in: b-proteobacteria)]